MKQISLPVAQRAFIVIAVLGVAAVLLYLDLGIASLAAMVFALILAILIIPSKVVL